MCSRMTQWGQEACPQLWNNVELFPKETASPCFNSYFFFMYLLFDCKHIFPINPPIVFTLTIQRCLRSTNSNDGRLSDDGFGKLTHLRLHHTNAPITQLSLSLASTGSPGATLTPTHCRPVSVWLLHRPVVSQVTVN